MIRERRDLTPWSRLSLLFVIALTQEREQKRIFSPLIPSMLFEEETHYPSLVEVHAESGRIVLGTSSGQSWHKNAVTVELVKAMDRLEIELRSEHERVERIVLTWPCRVEPGIRLMNDAWERAYGDLEWSPAKQERVYPWYFLAHNGTATWAAGVRTAPSAFCHWTLTAAELCLVCDVRSGVRGIDLGARSFSVASVVTALTSDLSPFEAASQFCRRMCDPVPLPAAPVFGFNDWHYGLGRNSPDTVMRDAHLLAELAPVGPDRPFFMIDAGWQLCGDANGGPWDRGNRVFGDMKRIADRIRAQGVRPGIWMRPLRTHERLPETWLGRRDEHGVALDPSIPEVLEYISEDVTRIASEWGYEMIKHDFSTYDIFGRWGFEMGSNLTCDRTLSFQDESRSTAEIIRSLYEAIRSAAGSSLIDGCNCVGHLAPGSVDLQRTGDDTSGYDWDRTRRMGVNALAFRMPQHRVFFLADADCVGMTRKVPWHLNRQWLELLAASGTPLLVSAGPDGVGPEQKEALRRAYALSVETQSRSTLEPLDWFESRTPARWVTRSQEGQAGEATEPALCFDWSASA